MTKHLALLTAIGILASPWLAASPAAAVPAEKPKGEAAKPAEKLEWLAFDAASVKAKAQQKHMIVDIYTTWCGWCRVMDKQTYGNPTVAAYLRENFVLAKVNGESTARIKWAGKDLTERQFAKAVGVSGYPATYFFKPDAQLLGGMSGYLEPPEFMLYAQYVATKWYEKGKIGAYADSLRAANTLLQDTDP
jgi:uncharacterized protein YyaL (SSP411 family)